MNELKVYVAERISKYRLIRPSAYDDSFYSSIKTPEDVMKIIQYAENLIVSYEKETNSGYLEDVEDRYLAIYHAYIAVKKAGICLSEFSCLTSSFDSLTRNEFDAYFDVLDNLIDRNGVLNSRFISST